MIWVLLLLSLLLLLLLLPSYRVREGTAARNHSEENLRLYEERTEELQASDMDDEEKSALQLELDREFLANAEPETASGQAQSGIKRWPLAFFGIFQRFLCVFRCLWAFWDVFRHFVVCTSLHFWVFSVFLHMLRFVLCNSLKSCQKL